jgi:LPS-assembly lipoprotein
MKYSIRIGLILFLSLLTACGFHLRGSITLPDELKNLYLFGESAALKTEIEQILRSSKGKIAASPNEAGVVIKVMKEDLRRRILSIGSTGKSSEFELNYYLRFQIYDKQEVALMDEQTIELSREYFNDQTAVLAKEGEEAIIRKEMYKQVARMLIARTQLAVENKKH